MGNAYFEIQLNLIKPNLLGNQGVNCLNQVLS